MRLKAKPKVLPIVTPAPLNLGTLPLRPNYVSLALFLAIVAVLVVLLDLGSALAGPLAGVLRWLAVACGLTILIDLPFALTILVLEMAMGRLKGMRVEYG